MTNREGQPRPPTAQPVLPLKPQHHLQEHVAPLAETPRRRRHLEGAGRLASQAPHQGNALSVTCGTCQGAAAAASVSPTVALQPDSTEVPQGLSR